jgi:hypothetical protein
MRELMDILGDVQADNAYDAVATILRKVFGKPYNPEMMRYNGGGSAVSQTIWGNHGLTYRLERLGFVRGAGEPATDGDYSLSVFRHPDGTSVKIWHRSYGTRFSVLLTHN